MSCLQQELQACELTREALTSSTGSPLASSSSENRSARARCGRGEASEQRFAVDETSTAEQERNSKLAEHAPQHRRRTHFHEPTARSRRRPDRHQMLGWRERE